MPQTGIAQRVIDWEPIRKAFVERPKRLTYAELSVEFSIGESSIKTCAADEGWAMMRARRLELEMQRADAAQIIVEAAASDRAAIERFRTLAIRMVNDTLADVESIAGEFTAAKRLNLRQTASFTILNLAQALKNVGLTGVPKELRDGLGGSGASGEAWKAAVLVQVNQMAGAVGSVSVGPAGKSGEVTKVDPA